MTPRNGKTWGGVLASLGTTAGIPADVFPFLGVILGLFGLVHLLLIWNGDILTQYAFPGLLLLPLVGASDRTLVRWFWVFLAMHLVLPMLAVPFWPDLDTLRRLLDQANRIYATGTWGEVRIHSWVEWLVMLPMIWIGLAVQAKRWHDQDKSAWWILINFVPFVGGLIVLIMCGFIAGTPGPNRFGDVPAI